MGNYDARDDDLVDWRQELKFGEELEIYAGIAP